MGSPKYAGFWIRAGAAVVDSILIFTITLPTLNAIYGPDYWISGSLIRGFWDVLINYLLPPIAIIIFWIFKSATPGKMVMKLTIIDAKTGGKPSMGQFVIRFIGYYVALFPLFLGFIWIGIDKRKQGLHDKLAKTLVLKKRSGSIEKL